MPITSSEDEQRAEPLTVEEELPRDIALAVGARVGQVLLRLRIVDGLLVKLVAGELRNTRYFHGAKVLVLDY